MGPQASGLERARSRAGVGNCSGSTAALVRRAAGPARGYCCPQGGGMTGVDYRTVGSERSYCRRAGDRTAAADSPWAEPELYQLPACEHRGQTDKDANPAAESQCWREQTARWRDSAVRRKCLADRLPGSAAEGHQHAGRWRCGAGRTLVVWTTVGLVLARPRTGALLRESIGKSRRRAEPPGPSAADLCAAVRWAGQ